MAGGGYLRLLAALSLYNSVFITTVLGPCLRRGDNVFLLFSFLKKTQTKEVRRHLKSTAKAFHSHQGDGGILLDFLCVKYALLPSRA